MSGGRPEGTSPQGPAALTAPRVVAVLFGGRSLEHDVSIVSGQQILHALDPASCTAIPVYIDQQLRWWIGDDLWHPEPFRRGGPDRSRLTEVQLAPGFGVSSAARSRWARAAASSVTP